MALEQASESRPTAVARFYHPELDGLRLVAMLFVFIHHITPQQLFPGAPHKVERVWALFKLSGALGVDLFFCLSAYLITMLLLIEWESKGGVSVRRFYIRRILRIWPLYFGFLALVFALPALGLHQEPLGAQTLPFLLFVGNWSSAFLGAPNNVAGPLWSVSLEEQFYITWPLLLRQATPAKVARVAWGMIALSMLSRCVVVVLGWPHPATWCLTFTRLDCLGVGILLAAKFRDLPPPAGAVRRVATFFGGLLAWMIAMYLWPILSPPTWGAALFAYPMVALGAGAMLLAVLAPAGRGSGVLSNPTLVYLGKISYGLYVFHLLGGECAKAAFPHAGEWVRFAVALGFTVAMAALSYAFLERPFLRLKDRFSSILSRPA